jgi:hypothetical protein
MSNLKTELLERQYFQQVALLILLFIVTVGDLKVPPIDYPLTGIGTVQLTDKPCVLRTFSYM